MLAASEADEDIKPSVETPSPPVVSTTTDVPSTHRQHLSRLSQFQRNTVHLCDQIHEHA